MPGCWDFFKRRRKPPERVNNYRNGVPETSTSVNQHSAVIVVQGIAEGTQIRQDENDDNEISRHSNAM